VESVPAHISRADEHELVVDLERGILLRLSVLLRGRKPQATSCWRALRWAMTGGLMRFAWASARFPPRPALAPRSGVPRSAGAGTDGSLLHPWPGRCESACTTRGPPVHRQADEAPRGPGWEARARRPGACRLAI